MNRRKLSFKFFVGKTQFCFKAFKLRKNFYPKILTKDRNIFKLFNSQNFREEKFSDYEVGTGYIEELRNGTLRLVICGEEKLEI